MKKILLSTTAMVGAFALSQAAAAQTATTAPLTIYLGGQIDFHGAIINEKNNNGQRSYTSETDTSVLLTVKSNNNDTVNYGARVQLLPSQNDIDQTDEYVVYVEGYAGTVELGQADGATDRLAVSAPSDFGTGGVKGQYYQFINPNVNYANGQLNVGGFSNSYKAFDDNGANKITYFSPRYEGFQFGVSFAPDGSQIKNNRTTAVAGTTNGLLDATSFDTYIEPALNYQGEFEGVGVKASAGYVYAKAKKSAAIKYDDLNAVQTGFQLGYEGFTFGGGYVYQGTSGYNKASNNHEQSDAYNVGLQYETGPFVLGTNALFGRNEGSQSTRADAVANVYSIGATYKVAPGLSTYIEGTNVNYKGSGATSPSTSPNDDATVVILGTSLAF